MRLAVLGIGLMGYPMARRLCQAGHCVHVWNRTLHKAQRLLPDGASVHQGPAEAVAKAAKDDPRVGEGVGVVFTVGAVSDSKDKRLWDNQPGTVGPQLPVCSGILVTKG